MRTMVPTLNVLPSLCGKPITSKRMENPWPRSSLVGVCPVSDLLDPVNKVELIPLEVLGCPRVDVLVSCSGVFHYLFINQMKRWPPRPTSFLTRTLSASTPSSRPQSSISRYAIPLARDWWYGWPVWQVTGDNMLHFFVVRQFSNHLQRFVVFCGVLRRFA